MRRPAAPGAGATVTPMSDEEPLPAIEPTCTLIRPAPSPAPLQEIALSVVRSCEAISPRLALSQSQIKEFTQIIQERGTGAFPPLILAGPREDGSYAPLDGRHRLEAARRAGAPTFPASIRP